MPKIKKKAVFIFILLLIILYVVITVIPRLTGALTQTEVVEYGDIRIESEAKCCILRDETVYTASATGSTKYFIEEGTQIKAGTPILELTPTGEKDKKTETKYDAILKRIGNAAVVDDDHVSKRKGVLTYHVDGYEKNFSVENLGKLDYEKTKALEVRTVNVKSEKVTKGAPIFKICDNSKWYIVFWADQADTAKYQVGNHITAVLPKGEIRGTIVNITQDGKQWQVTIETNQYYENFTKERVIKGTIRTMDASGLIINNGSLTTKGKQVGAYVKKTTGDFVFMPVQVIVSDGERSLIAEGTYFDEKGLPVDTVKVYDEVLRNPKAETSQSKDKEREKAKEKDKEKEEET